jgi:SAM-dependent methyltransferase
MYIHATSVHNKTAGREVIPLIIDMLQPQSVLDVGCGIGTWLSVFKEMGVRNILGIDGEYVDKKLLAQNINEDEFIPVDLSRKFDLNKRFDLVLCLEVAEHLPEICSREFALSLSRHSDQIVFSAAIPGQIGQGHINEQWLGYWVEIFSELGYPVYDIFRPKIWENPKVDWWYRQNMVLFSCKDIENENLKNTALSFVHPENYKYKVQKIEDSQSKIDELQKELNMWIYSGQPILKYWNGLKSSILKKIKL